MAVLLVAGALVLPLTSAWGEDPTVGLGTAQGIPSATNADRMLPLPPVPYLDTMLWLNSRALLGPPLETLGAFMVDPATLSPRFPATFAERFPDRASEERLKTQ
jgi:hypothetical protein